MKRSPSESIPSAAPRAGADRAALRRFVLVALLVLAADLAAKHLAFRLTAGHPVDPATAASADFDHEPRVLVPGVLALKLTLNQGAAFGLGQGGRWVFVVVALAALVIIAGVFRSSRADARVLHAALGLLMAGALGNLYDRILYGRVRDMLWLLPDVRLPFGWSWPGGSREVYPWIFNVADAAMCVGLAVLLIQSLARGPAGDGDSARERSPS
jgi:signal peptidase II